VKALADRLAMEIVMRNTNLQMIKKSFENIGDYPKKVPKIGRPILSLDNKLQRRMAREFALTGQLSLYGSSNQQPRKHLPANNRSK